MSENKVYNVKNRSAGSVVYSIPELGIRREFAPGEVKKIGFVELEKLSFIPGGKYIMAEYFQIDQAEVNKEFNIKTEYEYNMGEAEVVNLIKFGSQDEWLDALDFSPIGVIDLIKKFSVSVPLTDTRKIESLLEKTGFNAAKAIEMNKADKEVEKPAAETPQRRVKPAGETSTGRRTTPKYKIVSDSAEVVDPETAEN